MSLATVRLARECAGAAGAALGQLLFCESPVAGALLLLALALVSPRAAITSACACVVSTLLARGRGYARPAWRRGLYGYAGALAGLWWGVLFAPGPGATLALGGAALLAPPLTRLAHRLLTPREVPALALPALAVVWAAARVLAPAPVADAPTMTVEVVAWSLAIAGLAGVSWLLALAAVLGAAVGVGLGAWSGAVSAGLLANTVPTAIALGVVFLPPSATSLAIAALGAAGAGAAWAITAPVLAAAGWPLLIAPFNLVTAGVLGLLRVPGIRSRLPGRPIPLPLLVVRTPEQGLALGCAVTRLHDLVGSARRICVLTGAGVSTAAGLPDVRGVRSAWLRTSGVTLDRFLSRPDARAAYWREEEQLFRLVRRAAPTTTHHALAALDRQGRITAVITQNVDGLHQATGMREGAVIELHGSIHVARCVDCGRPEPRANLSTRIGGDPAGPYCLACQGLMQSGSVLFGEPVAAERLDAALRALLASDLLLVLGTSLVVAPASDLLRWAREAGIPVAIVNALPTAFDRDAAVTVTADVGAVLLDLVHATAVS